MVKRLSKKSVASRLQAADSFANTQSTISLSSAGQRFRTYHWRYLQLIKDGLVWLTGKRTRAARASQSAVYDPVTALSSRSRKSARKLLRFKEVRRNSRLSARRTTSGFHKLALKGKGRGRVMSRRGKLSQKTGRSRSQRQVKKTSTSRPSLTKGPKRQVGQGRKQRNFPSSAFKKKQKIGERRAKILLSRQKVPRGGKSRQEKKSTSSSRSKRSAAQKTSKRDLHPGRSAGSLKQGRPKRSLTQVVPKRNPIHAALQSHQRAAVRCPDLTHMEPRHNLPAPPSQGRTVVNRGELSKAFTKGCLSAGKAQPLGLKSILIK